MQMKLASIHTLALVPWLYISKGKYHQKKIHFIILVQKLPFDRHARMQQAINNAIIMIIVHVVEVARHPLTFCGCSSVFWTVSAAMDAEDVTIAATLSDLSLSSLRLTFALPVPTESAEISVILATVALPCPSSLKSVILIDTLCNARSSSMADMSRLYEMVVPRSIVCDKLMPDVIVSLRSTVFALLQPTHSRTTHISQAHAYA